MRIPAEALKCVGFIGSRSADGPDRTVNFRGTVFFLARPIDGVPGRYMQFAVTARHVLDGIRAKGYTLCLRLTTHILINNVQKFPISAWVDVPLDGWVEHSDRSVDAAIWPLPELQFSIDLKHIYPDMVLTDSVIKEEGIGVGNEVFMPGLFVNRPGDIENIPIVRVGNIAAMRDKVYNEVFGDMDAYLVEARSIGGLSGSPAFIHLGFDRVKPGGKWPIYWMGLVHGHFDGGLMRADAAVEDGAEMRRERVNMGIAIVVPSARILEIFEEPVLNKFESDASAAAKIKFAGPRGQAVP